MRFTAGVRTDIVVQTPIHHFERQRLERLLQFCQDGVGQIDQHVGQRSRGGDLQFNGILRATPEVGQAPQAPDDSAGFFNAPVATIQGSQIGRGQAPPIHLMFFNLS